MAGGHRATLKQTNKAHNHGRHRSKRNRKREAQGKVNLKTMTKNKQVKALLRNEILEKRTGERQDTFDQHRHVTAPPPRLVAVVPLHKSVNFSAVLDLLKEADISSECKESDQHVQHVSACKFKNRMSFIVPDLGNLQAVLDASKVADVILFLVSAQNGMDKYGQHCLTCIIGQGVPAHVFACQGLSVLSKKKASDARKMIEKQIERRFPGEKARSIDNWQDSQALWRQLANTTQQPVHFRDSRAYMLAEKVEFQPNDPSDAGDEEDEGPAFGTLKLTGYVRGQDLNVNQLIHIPGWGDFQMSQIDENEDPYPLIAKGTKDRRGMSKEKGDAQMADAAPTTVCLAKATNPESLQSEIIPDEMDQEQTWPTPDELGEDKNPQVKSLKGVSDYQRNWILGLEEEGEDDDEEDDEDEDMEASKEDEMKDDDEEEDDDLDAMTEEPGDEDYDKMIDMAEEQKMYEKMKEERSHVHFPDEIDTPRDVDARTRFARYRGMDSFQTTAWDYNDSLPYDYARIFRISKHHYKRLRKISVLPKEDDDDDGLPAEPGVFVTVHVKSVPKSLIDLHKPGSVVTLYGLFSNEQKMTLISTLIARSKGFKSPVKTKDPLIFQIGFRRFSACPIFSEHSYQNKFKMERFLPSSGFIVASMYAPIMFAPAPVLVFRENVMEKHDLVAKGSLLPLDTNRIVTKRVVLSGAPFKINKKSVVVRYMFFNREDIEFYKPIELKTKRGKRGHIKQALGTHGHMKCTFNGTLKSEDSVLMYLYKRVYPKWSYNPIAAILPPTTAPEGEDEDDDDEEMDQEHDEEKGDAYKLFD